MRAAGGLHSCAPEKPERESRGQNSEDAGSLTCLPGGLELLIQGSEILCHLIGAELGEWTLSGDPAQSKQEAQAQMGSSPDGCRGQPGRGQEEWS